MLVDGIECKKVQTFSGSPPIPKELYAKIPLDVLHTLPPRSGMSKFIILLYAYGRMKRCGWFHISNNVLSGYGISPARKRQMLRDLEIAGFLKLRTSPGKAAQIKLINPKRKIKRPCRSATGE